LFSLFVSNGRHSETRPQEITSDLSVRYNINLSLEVSSL